MSWDEIANIIGGDSGPEFFDHGGEGIEALGKLLQKLIEKLMEIDEDERPCD